MKFIDQLNAQPVAIQEAIAPAVIGLQASAFAEWEIITAGLRYDISSRAAFKAEWSKFTNELDAETDANIYRLAIHYIF
ncbi:hypothetical protein [Alteromonas oceanisediminis]|uniref:hypothetical protein n=1 Tax=Alteromonas oceanisediminis TaxID=2836180 RepID=UPI001BDAD499|nr:hypothetical protein [Alteromonas oceanisediminis]MBT0585183.1 hypothetical protein [Alteromonas oceanisediminis]